MSVFRNESASSLGSEVGLLAMEATWSSIVQLKCADVSVEHAAAIVRVNISGACSGDVRFEFHLTHRPFWLRFVVTFLRRSKKMPRCYIQIGHDHIFSHPYLFIILAFGF